MDASVASVIGASIAGLVALASSGMAFFNMRKQLELSQREAQNMREHQFRTTSYQKLVSAIESLWVSMYRLQREKKLSLDAELSIIADMVWVSDAVRRRIGVVIKAYGSGSHLEQRDAIIAAQDELLDFINSVNKVEVKNGR